MEQPLPVLILAVDDEALILELLVSALEDGGYDVVQATSAEEALAILDKRGGTLGGLVTDINLGRGKRSGWELGQRARELKPDVPVVYVSGDSSHEWTARGVPHSVMLTKPFAQVEVVNAVAGLRKLD